MKLLLAVHKRLPLGEASVTVGRAGEREKKARGDDGKGKEKPRAFYFFDKSHNALLIYISVLLSVSVQGDRIIFSVRGSLEANLAFSQEGFVSRLYIGTQENLVMQEYEPFPFRRLNQIGRPKLI